MTAALVLVDLQNAFCRADGSFARRGFKLAERDAVLAACLRLRGWADQRGLPVVFTRLVYRTDYADAGLLVADQPEIRALEAYVAGSWDAELVRELAPRPADLVIDKTRYDPFLGTGLEGTLRARGVDELVVAGLTTNVCVESTVRSAYDRDFRAVVVADATTTYDAELHRAALATLGRHFARVARVADLVDA